MASLFVPVLMQILVPTQVASADQPCEQQQRSQFDAETGVATPFKLKTSD